MVNALDLPYNGGIEAAGAAGDGTLTLGDGGKGSPGFKVECAGGTTCTYSAAAVPLDVHGGNPATLTAAATLNYESGSGTTTCGATAQLTAGYAVNTPAPLFVTGGS